MGRVRRRRLQRRHDHVLDLVHADRARPTRALLITQPVEAVLDEPAPPLADRVRRAPQLLGQRSCCPRRRRRPARSSTAAPTPATTSPDATSGSAAHAHRRVRISSALGRPVRGIPQPTTYPVNFTCTTLVSRVRNSLALRATMARTSLRCRHSQEGQLQRRSSALRCTHPADAKRQRTSDAGHSANVTLDTSSIQFYLSLYCSGFRQGDNVAPTTQQVSVDAPASTPETGTPQRRLVKPGWLLTRLAPRRISAVYLWAVHRPVRAAHGRTRSSPSVTFRLSSARAWSPACSRWRSSSRSTAGAYDLSIGAVMSVSLGAGRLPLAAHRHAHAGDRGAHRGGRLRALRRGVRLHRRAAARQLVHRDARREPGAVGAVLLISNNRSWSASSRTPGRTSATATCSGSRSSSTSRSRSRSCSGTSSSSRAIGRYLFATGGNPEAARLAGVPTDRMIWGVFVASAA